MDLRHGRQEADHVSARGVARSQRDARTCQRSDVTSRREGTCGEAAGWFDAPSPTDVVSNSISNRGRRFQGTCHAPKCRCHPKDDGRGIGREVPPGLAEVKAYKFAEWSIDEMCFSRDQAADFCKLVRERVGVARLTRVFILRSLVGLKKNPVKAQKSE